MPGRRKGREGDRPDLTPPPPSHCGKGAENGEGIGEATGESGQDWNEEKTRPGEERAEIWVVGAGDGQKLERALDSVEPVPKGGVIRGQRVDRTLVERSRGLRGSMTVAEQVLWTRLRRNQIDGLHFRRQQIIGSVVADFYCEAARLVVEVDGGIHLAQRTRDAERDRVLTSRGLRILRLTNETVLEDIDGALNRIAAVVRDPFRFDL